MHYNIIKTAAGARTRLRLPMVWKADALAAEELPEAVFWVFIGGDRVRVEKTPGSDDEYIFPALQSGQYAWDLVVDAQVVLHGVLKVRGSAVPPGGGEVCGTLLVDAPATVLVLSPGPRGEVGPVGPQGLSAYEVALQHGYEGSEDEWAEELSGAQAAATESKRQAGLSASSAAAAANSATAAQQSATAAGNSASDSAQSATAAASSATTAKEQATAAGNSATAAASSAGAAGEQATAASNSATAAATSADTAGKQATAAASSATAAASSATAAGNAATAAADTLAAAPKLNGNNTFSGTNTFNGMLAANGGITGLPQPNSETAAISRDAAYMSDIYMQTRSVKAVPELQKTSGEGTVSGQSITSKRAGLTAAEASNFDGYTFFPVGGYHNIAAGWVDLPKVNLSSGGAFRLTLNLAETKSMAYQRDNLDIPALNWRDFTRTGIFHHAYIEITVQVHTEDTGADVTLRGLNITAREATGMRECRSSIPHNETFPITGISNVQGIIGVFFTFYSGKCRVFLVPDASTTKPIFIGEVSANATLYRSYERKLQVIADNADVTCGDITLWRGSIRDVSMGVLAATTPSDLTTNDYNFEELEVRYPEA